MKKVDPLTDTQEEALKELDRVFFGFDRAAIIKALGVMRDHRPRPPLKRNPERDKALVECQEVLTRLQKAGVAYVAITAAIHPYASIHGLRGGTYSEKGLGDIKRGSFTKMNSRGYENYRIGPEQAKTLLYLLEKIEVGNIIAID